MRWLVIPISIALLGSAAPALAGGKQVKPVAPSLCKPSEKVYMCCGTYESLIYENRSLVPLLQATGMDVRYKEARDGHNWINWRDRLREGLSWLFPGPLWMVYE